MVTFGRVFSDICNLRLILRFWFLEVITGNFFSLTLEFFKLNKSVWNPYGNICGGQFSDISLFEAYFKFLDFKG